MKRSIMDVLPTCWLPKRTILYLILPPTVEEERLIRNLISNLYNNPNPQVAQQYRTSKQLFYLLLDCVDVLHCLLSDSLTLLQLSVLLRNEMLQEELLLVGGQLVHHDLHNLLSREEVGTGVDCEVVGVLGTRGEVIEGDGGSIHQFGPFGDEGLIFGLNFLYDGLDAFHSAGQFLKSVLDLEHIEFDFLLEEGEIINLGLQVGTPVLLIIQILADFDVFDGDFFVAPHKHPVIFLLVGYYFLQLLDLGLQASHVLHIRQFFVFLYLFLQLADLILLHMNFKLILFLDFFQSLLQFSQLLSLLADHFRGLFVNCLDSLFVGAAFADFVLKAKLGLSDEEVVFDSGLDVDEEVLEVVVDFAEAFDDVVGVPDELLVAGVGIVFGEGVLKFIDVEAQFLLNSFWLTSCILDSYLFSAMVGSSFGALARSVAGSYYNFLYTLLVWMFFNEWFLPLECIINLDCVINRQMKGKHSSKVKNSLQKTASSVINIHTHRNSNISDTLPLYYHDSIVSIRSSSLNKNNNYSSANSHAKRGGRPLSESRDCQGNKKQDREYFNKNVKKSKAKAKKRLPLYQLYSEQNMKTAKPIQSQQSVGLQKVRRDHNIGKLQMESCMEGTKQQVSLITLLKRTNSVLDSYRVYSEQLQLDCKKYRHKYLEAARKLKKYQVK